MVVSINIRKAVGQMNFARIKKSNHKIMIIPGITYKKNSNNIIINKINPLGFG